MLRNAFTLALWVDIARRSEPPLHFASRTHLLRAYWEQQRKAVRIERGLRDADVNALLDQLVSYLDRERRLDAPRVLLNSHTVAAEALLSLGLLQQQGGRVRFAHQAHADYLIAQRVVSKILAEGTKILQWLEGDQSLFRREQVRQVLQMLRDDDPSTYVQAMAELLSSSDIRFHLRHLAVQVLRQVDDPLTAEVDLVVEVLQAGELTEYLSQHLLAYSPLWTRAILERGLVSPWLRSSNSALRSMALGVLGSCSEQLGDMIAAIALPVLRETGYASREIARLLPHDVATDSPSIFEERLKLARSHPWEAAPQLGLMLEPLVESAPSKALRLVHAIVEGALGRFEEPSKEDQATMQDLVHDDQLKAIGAAFKACPQEACDLYLPLLGGIGEAAARRAESGDYFTWHPLEEVVVSGLGAAGEELAKASPFAALAIVQRLGASTQQDRVAATTLIALNASDHADRAIEWISALAALSLVDHALRVRRLRAFQVASGDPNGAVRVAVQAAARQLLIDDPQTAIELFLAASDHEDDRVLASSEARRFVDRVWREQLNALEPLLHRMIASDVAAAAQLGAELIAAAWLFDGRLGGLLRQCQTGNPSQRRGVAAVAAVACSGEGIATEAIATLTPFFRDPDAEVRKMAAKVFSREGFLEHVSAPQIAAEYARSSAFLENPKVFINPLAEDLAQTPRFGDAIVVMAGRLASKLTPPRPTA